MSLKNEFSHLTSVRDGPTLSVGAKLPKFFDYPKIDSKEDKKFFNDPGMDGAITKKNPTYLDSTANESR